MQKTTEEEEICKNIMGMMDMVEESINQEMKDIMTDSHTIPPIQVQIMSNKIIKTLLLSKTWGGMVINILTEMERVTVRFWRATGKRDLVLACEMMTTRMQGIQIILQVLLHIRAETNKGLLGGHKKETMTKVVRITHSKIFHTIQPICQKRMHR